MQTIGVFERSNSRGAFGKIANLYDISGHVMSREILTLELHGRSDLVPGVLDLGKVKLTLSFSDTGYQLMKDDFTNATPKNYRIRTVSTVFAFSGYVIECRIPPVSEGPKTFDITIKLNRQPEIMHEEGG